VVSALLGVGIVRADHLWDTVPDAFAQGLGALEDTLLPAVAQGAVVARITEGTLVVSFAQPAAAAAAAFALLARELPWPAPVLEAAGGPPVVQIAVDLGEPLQRDSPLSGRVLEGSAIRRVMALARRCPRSSVLISAQAWAAGATAPAGHDVTAAHEAWLVSRGSEPLALGIPAGRGRFVGRGAELEALAAAVAGGQRFLALVGPGGAGKSRLAAEWARSTRAAWVDLAAEKTAEGAVAALARALRVSVGASGDPVAELGQALARMGPCAVVLDNTEQLPDDWLEVLLGCLERAPSLVLLLTSRRPTGLALEWRLPVGPLPQQEAIELLRVRSARPLGDEGLEQLVDALDRLPLALELAARRTSLGSAAEILEQLRQRPFRTLRRPPALAAGAPLRHDTLLATLDWSWELLSEEARGVFSALAAFAGRFRAKEAEQVVGELPGPPDGPDVAERLEELVDCSLVVTDGEGEHHLLDTVRAYSRLRLEQRPDMAQILARHARYCTSVPMGREGPGQLEELATLHRLCGDLFEIVERTAEREPATAAQAALRLTHRIAGVSAQARLAYTGRWRALAVTDPVIRARLHLVHGDALLDAGLADEAWAEFELACETAPEHVPVRVGVAMRRGMSALLGVDYARAMRCYVEAAELASSVQDHVHHAWAVAAQGRMLHQQLQFSEALSRLEVALALARRAGALEAEGSARSYKSMTLRRLGRLEEARAEALAAHRLGRQTLRPDLQGNSLIWAAAATFQGGDAGAAEAELLEVVHFARARGLVAVELAALSWLARVQHVLGKLDLVLATLAEEEALDSRPHRQRALTRAYVLCELGELQAGRRALAVARERSPPVAADLAEIDAWEALVCARSGEILRAEQLVENVCAAQGDWPELSALAGLLRIELDAQRARGAEERERTALLARCQQRLPSEVPVLAVSMARIVREGLRRLTLGEAQVVVVHDEHKALVLPGGRRLDFTRRGPLWRILRALLDARSSRPGAGLALEALIEAGWPGERIVAAAAANRAYVAVATLRKLGLGELLVTGDDGYRLSTELTFTWSPGS
jgi:predicted ATPase